MTTPTLAQKIATYTPLLPPLAKVVITYMDSLELLEQHNYHPNLLPADSRQQLAESARSCPRLDLQGRDITWNDLEALSPLFTQHQFLDLRNCPHLDENEQWTDFKTEERANHQGFQKLVRLFPYHNALEIQLTDTLAILSCHTIPSQDPERRSQNFGYAIYDEKGTLSTSGLSLEARPADATAEKENPYLLPQGFQPFQERMKREAAPTRQSVCSYLSGSWLKA